MKKKAKVSKKAKSVKKSVRTVVKERRRKDGGVSTVTQKIDGSGRILHERVVEGRVEKPRKVKPRGRVPSKTEMVAYQLQRANADLVAANEKLTDIRVLLNASTEESAMDCVNNLLGILRAARQGMQIRDEKWDEVCKALGVPMNVSAATAVLDAIGKLNTERVCVCQALGLSAMCATGEVLDAVKALGSRVATAEFESEGARKRSASFAKNLDAAETLEQNIRKTVLSSTVLKITDDLGHGTLDLVETAIRTLKNVNSECDIRVGDLEKIEGVLRAIGETPGPAVEMVKRTAKALDDANIEGAKIRELLFCLPGTTTLDAVQRTVDALRKHTAVDAHKAPLNTAPLEMINDFSKPPKGLYTDFSKTPPETSLIVGSFIFEHYNDSDNHTMISHGNLTTEAWTALQNAFEYAHQKKWVSDNHHIVSKSAGSFVWDAPIAEVSRALERALAGEFIDADEPAGAALGNTEQK